MSRVRFNIAANIAAQAWLVLLAIACTPFYIKFLGIEAYGLIAFYLILQSVLQLLDFGLGVTVNREVARYSGLRERADTSVFAAFVVTLERWYWVLGIIVGIALFFALPAISNWWLRPEHLSQGDIAESARVFSLLALLQWPSIFYQSALMGLQRQVVLNVIQMPFAALASIGGVIFIWLGPRSVAALIGWQAAVLLCQTAVLHFYFWAHIGIARAGTPGDLNVWRKHWRFSLGMSAISVTGLVLTHLDKLILSRLLPLQSFGHYSLAGTVARGLYVVITPVFRAYFPRLSALVAEGDAASVRLCYHTATQVMAVLILPLAAMIALFPREIIFLWLYDWELATAISSLASLLVVGTCLNGLMHVPFALQLAHGRTSIGMIINICLVVVLVPSIIYATLHYGALGGATMWAVVNALYLAVGIPATHKYLLNGEVKDWAFKDVLPPLFAAVLVTSLGRLLIPADLPTIYSLTALACLWILATLAALLSSGRMRQWGRSAINRLAT
jgi:O-antigen/teichoic acid export membrane protein